MRVVVLILCFIYAPVSTASTHSREFALGLALSGQIIGVSATARISNSLGGRLIISPRGGLDEYDQIQLQVHYFRDIAKEKHWLLAVGGRDGIDYLRGGIGQNIYRWGGLVVNWELALNIPLENSNAEGASQLIDGLETIQVFGLGLHYSF